MVIPGLAGDYAAGATVDELAARHGVNRVTIYDALKAEEVELRGHGSWGDILTREFLERRQDQPVAAIAREVGCSDATVRGWLGRHGLVRLDPSTTRKLKQMSKAGRSNAEMAEVLGCHPRTIRRWLVLAGLK